jgi:hypothetical protein
VTRRSDAFLTTSQVEAAYAVYKRGWSIARLARIGWQAWGYASEESAKRALRHAFRARGFYLRSRSVAAQLSHPARVLGEQRHVWHGEGLCQGRVVNYPNIGASCRRRVAEGKRYCSQHDPKRRSERRARLALVQSFKPSASP